MNLKPARASYSKPMISVSVQPGLQSEALGPKRKRLEGGKGVAQGTKAFTLPSKPNNKEERELETSSLGSRDCQLDGI